MPERAHTHFEGKNSKLTKLQRKAIGAQLSSLPPPIHGKKRKRDPITSLSGNTQVTQGISEKKNEDQRPATNSQVAGRQDSDTLAKSPKSEVKAARRQRPHGEDQIPSALVRLNGQHKTLNQRKVELLQIRKRLPIWTHADKIRRGLRGERDIMLLVGETGSGKSTQVPQFLVDEPWCKKCIAITQPRRVAAVSLAKRVAEEFGTPLGSSSPASKVGYSVRFDTSVAPSTKIKFLTEGMLLQEMLRDPWLKQYSAVIVDEVHERSVNVDLILGFLRNLVSGDKKGRNGMPLKVVVMSATADVESLFRFFNSQKNNPVQHGRDASVDEVDSEDSWSGICSDDDQPSQVSDANITAPPNGSSQVTQAVKKPIMSSNSISICHVEGRQYPVQVNYLSEPTQDFVEAALKAVFQIHIKEPLPGDILVFLTGQDTVEGLERLVNEYASTMDPKLPKILTLPLFAALPQAVQQKVFQPAPSKTRKVILSTNIAETSVTVPGVRYVVDSGKVKVKQFRNRLGLDSLLVKPVSQSSAIQRKGRAGREALGQCHRLYTEKDYLALQKIATPEILRCDLAQALITMKARGIDDVVNFPFLDTPPREALEKALLQLLQIGALDDTGKISDIGLKIAKLPLTPLLGKVIVEAAQPDKDCLLDMIDIVACLSVENIFLNLITEEKKEEAEAARRELYRRDGDHLTMLAVVKSYATENTNRKAWSERHFVSHRAMQNIMDIRKQLVAQCKQLDLLPDSLVLEDTDTVQSEARNATILQCLLRGFSSNTARLMPDGSYRTLIGNQTVAIHPSSILFGKKVEAIVFSEFVFTNKSYARSVSAVRLAWIDEVLADR